KLYKDGKVKVIGVSNFDIPKLNEILEKAEIKPVMNQIELHPYLPQHKLVKFCQDNEISKRNNMTPSQVILSWNAQRNVIVIPKSVTPSRIEENFQIKKLPQEDIDKINAITTRQRVVYPERFKVLNVFTDLGE
ncbi:hypothetical protein PIROE2DRAFT_2538, partial [Piromyces sp. E2]